MIDVRHALTVPFLQEYGGHIGYAVRPSERRKGYATAMLRLALQYCADLGIDAVHLGCYADNLPSIRTIERCDGIRIEEKTLCRRETDVYLCNTCSVRRIKSYAIIDHRASRESIKEQTDHEDTDRGGRYSFK